MSSLIFEKQNGVAYIKLNRPEAHNALDLEMANLLMQAWDEYLEDGDLRCAILTASGDKTFCSGADLKKITPLFTGAKKPENEFEEQLLSDPNSRFTPVLRSGWMHKPVVAAINGSAIAGGMEFLYGADIRVAAEHAKFGLQEVKWAVFPTGGSTVKLPQMMTYARAMELLLTGDLISARKALEWGFLNQVVPASEVMEAAEVYASKIAKNGPLAVRAVKESVLATWGLPMQEALVQELRIAMERVEGSEDSREGPRAFAEKREPVFKNR